LHNVDAQLSNERSAQEEALLLMTTSSELMDAVRDAWSSIPAPPVEDLKYMNWGWGEEAARAFTGVAPMDVDIDSVGFFAATPLLDIPPRAAAAYLGTFLVSLLDHLETQKIIGTFIDILSRAHTLTCLELPDFWNRAIRPFLPPKCRRVIADVVTYLVSERELLALRPEQVDTMLALAAEERARLG
jgi:hypothetical protein